MSGLRGSTDESVVATPGGPSVMLPLVPLVIGITGHRDLREADRPALEKEVTRVFKELDAMYRHTPLVVLSALAEGADRLAARVALEAGARLIVPLPMPRSLYEADFTAPGSLEEFSGLLAGAEGWFELPLRDGADEASVRAGGEARDQQYAALGEYLADNSQILLALWDGVEWDGVESKRLSGTAYTVTCKLRGSDTYHPRQRNPLDPPETGPVWQIVTPRVSNPQPEGRPFTLTRLYPQEYKSHKAAKKAYDEMCARTEGFNRDALWMTPARAAQREVSSTKLLPGNEAAQLPQELQVVRAAFGLADALACEFWRRTRCALNGIFCGVFLAAAAFALYAHVWSRPTLLSGYIALVWLVGLIWKEFMKRRDWQNKFQDYRTLAEGLRVQFFWGLAGIRCPVAMTYLRKQRGELEWIRNAIRAVTLWLTRPALAAEGLEGPEGVQRLGLVFQHWVESQRAYFAKAARRDNKRNNQWLRGATVLFWSGALASVLLFGLVENPWVCQNIPSLCTHLRLFGLSKEEPVTKWLIAVATLTMVAAALCHNYTEKRALSEHAKHYDRMSGVFARAKASLADFIDKGEYERAEGLLRDLGAEALQENGDWIILHRERPLDVPHEGVTPPAILKVLK